MEMNDKLRLAMRAGAFAIRNRVKSYGVQTGGIAECFIPKECVR